MPVHYSERLHSDILRIPKLLNNDQTAGERAVHSVTRLRVLVDEFLTTVGYTNRTLVETIAHFMPDDHLTFRGIVVPTGTGDRIELATAGSKRYDYGITLVGTQTQHSYRNGFSMERQQWIIPYDNMHAELWWAGPRHRRFELLQDTEKIMRVEPILQRLFTYGKIIWQAQH